MRFAALQQRCARAGVDSLFGERAGAPRNIRMRPLHRKRHIKHPLDGALVKMS
jgi:hypothetical protein